MKEERNIYLGFLLIWFITLILTFLFRSLGLPIPDYERNFWNNLSALLGIILFVLPGYILGYWARGNINEK